MKFPVVVQFRSVDASAALHSKISDHASRLAKFADDIQSCRVTVSAQRRPHHNGDRYHVDVHLLVGGNEIHVGDSHGHDPRHTDAYTAVADAFDVARRHVEDLARLRRETRPHQSGAAVERQRRG